MASAAFIKIVQVSGLSLCGVFVDLDSFQNIKCKQGRVISTKIGIITGTPWGPFINEVTQLERSGGTRKRDRPYKFYIIFGPFSMTKVRVWMAGTAWRHLWAFSCVSVVFQAKIHFYSRFQRNCTHHCGEKLLASGSVPVPWTTPSPTALFIDSTHTK